MRVQTRRTDTFPTTWELPAAIGLVWLLVTLLALPAGQAAAFALTGHGFAWPGPELGHSLLGLLAGDPGRGLPGALESSVPPAVLIYAVAAVIQAALTACALVALVWWSRTVGPQAQVGMASRHEVAAVLGRRQLNHRRTTIRPDLITRAPR